MLLFLLHVGKQVLFTTNFYGESYLDSLSENHPTTVRMCKGYYEKREKKGHNLLPAETLWNLSKAIDRKEEGGIAITA